MAVIANLDVNLGANTRKFSRGMKAAGKETKTLRGGFLSLAKAGGPLVAGLATAAAGFLTLRAGIRGVTDQFSQLDTLAKNAATVGVAAEELQALQIAAGKGGVALPTFTDSFRKMVVNIAKAKDGTGPAVSAIAELGLEVETLNNQTGDEQFKTIADAMQSIVNPADQARVAYELFGRQGIDIVNILRQGSEGIDAAGNTLKQFGLETTSLDAAPLEKFNDMFADLKTVIGGVFAKIATELAPVLGALAELFGANAGEAIDLGNVVTTAMEFVVKGIGAAIDAVNFLQGAWYALRGAVTTVVYQSVRQLANLEMAANSMASRLGISVGTTAQVLAEELARAADEDFEKAGDKFEAAFDGVGSAAFMQSVEAFRTSAQNATRIAAIDAGSLLEDVADDTTEAIEKTFAAVNPDFAAAGSSAAFSAINSARQRDRKRQTDLAAKMVEQQSRTNDLLSQIANAGESGVLIEVP